MNGLKQRAIAKLGGPKNRANCSEYSKATDLGHSSPKTICKYAISRKATGTAKEWASVCRNARGTGSCSNQAAINTAIVLSPIHPKAKLDSVMPSWVVDKRRSILLCKSWTVLACTSPAPTFFLNDTAPTETIE